jgi:hypothetical protein
MRAVTMVQVPMKENQNKIKDVKQNLFELLALTPRIFERFTSTWRFAGKPTPQTTTPMTDEDVVEIPMLLELTLDEPPMQVFVANFQRQHRESGAGPVRELGAGSSSAASQGQPPVASEGEAPGTDDQMGGAEPQPKRQRIVKDDDTIKVKVELSVEGNVASNTWFDMQAKDLVYQVMDRVAGHVKLDMSEFCLRFEDMAASPFEPLEGFVVQPPVASGDFPTGAGGEGQFGSPRIVEFKMHRYTEEDKVGDEGAILFLKEAYGGQPAVPSGAIPKGTVGWGQIGGAGGGKRPRAHSTEGRAVMAVRGNKRARCESIVSFLDGNIRQLADTTIPLIKNMHDGLHCIKSECISAPSPNTVLMNYLKAKGSLDMVKKVNAVLSSSHYDTRPEKLAEVLFAEEYKLCKQLSTTVTLVEDSIRLCSDLMTITQFAGDNGTISWVHGLGSLPHDSPCHPCANPHLSQC